eukprot:3949695-Pyramimonas_sp.AAC.1
MKYDDTEADEVFHGMAAEQAAARSIADASPLTTTGEWRDAVSKMGKRNGSHRDLRLCRATLVGSRMARGLSDAGLVLEENLTVKRFAEVFPDSNQRVLRLGRHFKYKT